MKIYCSSCDKVQPVKIDNCRDAKTLEPYQDIVCTACDLVIAAGTDIKREWVGLTDAEIMEMLDYGQYGRVPTYARNFVDAIEAKLKEKNHG
jgi:hypothetical protein